MDPQLFHCSKYIFEKIKLHMFVIFVYVLLYISTNQFFSASTTTTTPSLSATTPTNISSPPNWNHNNGSTMATTTIKTQQIQTSLVTNTTSSPPLSLLANKSSLFNNNNSNFTNNQTNAQHIQTNNTILQSQILLQTQISSSQTNNVKPIPNYGKPNLAPKPPTQQLLSVKTNGRATVSRHHSMKSPR
jgi:hypothetical protein